MSQIKNKSNAATYRPRVTFHTAKHSYFLHAGTIYSVRTAPAEIFREAVLSLMPQWSSSALYGPLIANPDDLADRWFLLVSLAEAKRPIKLYASRANAEQ